MFIYQKLNFPIFVNIFLPINKSIFSKSMHKMFPSPKYLTSSLKAYLDVAGCLKISVEAQC